MSRLPLYAEAVSAVMEKDSHAGLWFDKFVNTWGSDWTKGLKAEKGGRDPKREWIKYFCDYPMGDAATIGELTSRRRAMVEQMGGRVFEAANSTCFVTGMGRAHPLENGFSWHPTLGTPYLPGSGFKGLARNWAEQWREDEAPDDCNRIFGSREQSESARGSVVFMDVLPLAPVRMKMEVMTPHYGDYYQKLEIPGDWLSPVPIPFLAVAPGQRFQFALLPCDPLGADDLDVVCRWMTDILSLLGCGAKTSSGYGRFDLDAAEQSSLVPVKPVPPFDSFVSWYDAQGFSAANKQRQGEIRTRIEAMTEPEDRSRAKLHARKALGKKGCSDKMWQFLSQE